MFGQFKWSIKVILWLTFVVIVVSIISFNMPIHPKPSTTVFLPGYEFMQYGAYIIALSFLLSALRNKSIILNAQANWLEAFIALTGAAVLISPFVALLCRLFMQVVTNVNT